MRYSLLLARAETRLRLGFERLTREPITIAASVKALCSCLCSGRATDYHLFKR